MSNSLNLHLSTQSQLRDNHTSSTLHFPSRLSVQPSQFMIREANESSYRLGLLRKELSVYFIHRAVVLHARDEDVYFDHVVKATSRCA